MLCVKILHFKEQCKEPTAKGAPHFGLKQIIIGGALTLSFGGSLVSCGTSSLGTFGFGGSRGEIFNFLEDCEGFEPAESGRFEEGGKSLSDFGLSEEEDLVLALGGDFSPDEAQMPFC